jgi:DNA-binding CsgD family transcriptional regulator
MLQAWHNGDLGGAVWTVLESAQSGYVLLESNGAICRTTPKADRYLARNDGLASIQGKICGGRDSITRRLMSMIEQTAGAADGPRSHASSLVVPRPSGARGYFVSFLPVEHRDPVALHGVMLVLMSVADPSDELTISEAHLRDLFGLNRSEARVANGLLNGRDLKQIAAELRIGICTVRSYLQQVFDKTETNRQSELVRVLFQAVGYRA